MDSNQLGIHDPEAIGQWLSVYGSQASKSAEVDLFWAILIDAINVLVKVGSKKTKRGEEEVRATEAWFMGHRAPVSYEFICEVLGIECPGRLREGVFRRRRERLLARCAA